MLLTLTPDELLSTTRSVRKRLDFTRPVEPEVVRECLALAIQAPNFGNGQPWRWMVVSDPTKRQALGACYRRGYDRYRQPADSDRAALDHVQASEPERVARERRRISVGDIVRTVRALETGEDPISDPPAARSGTRWCARYGSSWKTR